MLDYSFGQSLDRYYWSTGQFRDTTSQIGLYTDGIPSFSLGLLPEKEKTPEMATGNKMPATPPSVHAQKNKKSKAWIWFLIIPVIVAISFFAYKKLKS